MKWSHDELCSFYVNAKDELYKKQSRFKKENNIAILEHSKYIQNSNIIGFSSGDGKNIYYTFVPVGTLTKTTGSWLWAWDNRIYSRRITEPYLIIRKFGMKHGIEKLQRCYWEGSQEDAELMTAILCKLIDGNGMYVKVNKLVDLYLVLTARCNENEF
ncbi:MAG: DUF6882 domain-containing protein [Sedimenticola sp.]